MEVIAEIYVKERIKIVTDRQKAEHRYRNDENIIKFKKKYSDRLNHLRGPSVVRFDKTLPTELLFSVLRPFSKVNRQNILIQGDSWAEAAKYSQDFIKNLVHAKHSA